MFFGLFFKISIAITKLEFDPINQNEQWYERNNYEFKYRSIKEILTQRINTTVNITLFDCQFQYLSSAYGGAIYIDVTSIYNSINTIDKCLFINCSSIHGGAIYIKAENFGSTTELKNSLFENNFADEFGGAIYSFGSTLKINNCSFIKNYLRDNHYMNFHGGCAVLILKSHGYFNNSKFIGNYINEIDYHYDDQRKCSLSGAAVLSDISNFTNCSFISNSFYTERIHFHNEIYILGGAVCSNSSNFCKCIFNCNSIMVYDAQHTFVITEGGAVYSNYSFFEKCNFIGNSIYRNNDDLPPYDYEYEKSQGGGAVFSNYSEFNNCIFESNKVDIDCYYYYYRYTLYNFSGGGAVNSDYATFNNCIFNNNSFYSTNINSSDSGGGALLSKISLYVFNCSFNDNYLFAKINRISCQFYGGAIASFDSLILENCIFNNNYMNASILINDCQFYGGAIFSKGSSNYTSCIFSNNFISLNANYSFSLYGGAIYNSNQSIFINCSFINNSIIAQAFTLSESGAAIVGIGLFKNNTFINNKLILNGYDMSKKEITGAVINIKSSSLCEQCSFINNIMNIHLKNPSLTICGLIYFGSDYFYNCTFIDNSIVLYNDLAMINGNIYLFSSSSSILLIDGCKFINNTSFAYEESNMIYGGGLYIDNHSVIKNSDFINNSANVYCDYSVVYGSINIAFSTNRSSLTNCKFINNSALALNDKVYAICITINSSIIEGCYFCDNHANSGHCLTFIYTIRSTCTINNCIFEEHFYSKQIAYPIIYFFNSEINNVTYFTNSKVFIYNSDTIFVFDNPSTYHYSKFVFDNNCIVPYDEKYFKSDRMIIRDESNQIVQFNQAFESNCIPTVFFSASFDFTYSDYFSESMLFSNSIAFTKSMQFSSTTEFTKSMFFSSSSKFSISMQFSNSIEFTKSMFFSSSPKYSISKFFSNSNEFTKSIYFSISNKFTKSSYFSTSNGFTKSFLFTTKSKENDLYDSNIIKISTFYSNSGNIIKTTSNQNDVEIKTIVSQTMHSIIESDDIYGDSIPKNSSKKNGFNIITIIGIVIGVVAVIAFILLFFFIYKKKKKEKEEDNQDIETGTTKSKNQTTFIDNSKIDTSDEEDADLNFWL